MHTMDLNKSLQNYYFMIQTDDFKNSIANTKPCPRLKPGSKSQKMILQRPFNFEKYELLMSSIEKVDVKSHVECIARRIHSTHALGLYK